MIKINCDIGERGHDHPVDTQLMEHIHLANIACGGHAGDEQSIAAFRGLADRHGVKVAAHLSYPDRDNFGRFSMEIANEDLLKSLDEQYALISDVKCVKFHGALYNDCWTNRQLAALLSGWLKNNGITEIVTPFDSELAASCKELGISVIPEAFAERRYAYNPHTKRLTLVARSKDYASIHDCDEAVAHARNIIESGTVEGHIDDGGKLKTETVRLEAETICIHSDSAIALELAQKLADV